MGRVHWCPCVSCRQNCCSCLPPEGLQVAFSLLNQAPGNEGSKHRVCLPLQEPKTTVASAAHAEWTLTSRAAQRTGRSRHQTLTWVPNTLPLVGHQDQRCSGWETLSYNETAARAAQSPLTKLFSQRWTSVMPCSRGVLSFQKLHTQES